MPPIKIEIHSVESILPSVDRSACCHALAAIFRNAVEADASEIVVTIQDEAGMSRLYFDDDGSGIEAAQRIRVFAPFFTLRPNGTHAGLGLAAARAVAVAHGGDIEALDSPRGGARIAMRLRRPPCPASG